MFGKRGVMETTDDREGRACGWSAAWEGFRACGREVLLPVVAKVPKSTIQGEGDFVFPLPLKNPHPLKRPMRGPRPPPLEPPRGEAFSLIDKIRQLCYDCSYKASALGKGIT